MLDLNIHVRQELGEWLITGVLVESHSGTWKPDVSTHEMRLPLTDREWSQDPLTALQSALQRWLGVTSECKRLQP
jgi:hypothetical protein